jgi:hypothetical protein
MMVIMNLGMFAGQTRPHKGINKRGMLPSSGEKYIKRSGKTGWQVSFNVDGVSKYFGCRPTLEEAIKLRDESLAQHRRVNKEWPSSHKH